MILVTVGTEKFPFDRLIKYIDSAVEKGLIKTDVFIQIGKSNYIPQHCIYKTFLPFDELVDVIKKSEIVISHAAEGTLLLCISLGKIPILFPRNPNLGEHLDAHQIDSAQRFNSSGWALIVYSEEQLIEAIKNYAALTVDLKKKTHSDRHKLINFLRKICTQD